jgi:hypothetical protein
LLLGTASSLITCRRYDEAGEILDRIGAQLPTCTTQNPKLQRVLPTYLFVSGFLRYVTGRMEEALNYFLQTYSVLERTRGPSSSAVADILLALIDFPGLLQKPEDVTHWQRKFAELQAKIMVEADADQGVRHDRAAWSDLDAVCDGPLDTDVNTGLWWEMPVDAQGCIPMSH